MPSRHRSYMYPYCSPAFGSEKMSTFGVLADGSIPPWPPPPYLLCNSFRSTLSPGSSFHSTDSFGPAIAPHSNWEADFHRTLYRGRSADRSHQDYSFECGTHESPHPVLS